MKSAKRIAALLLCAALIFSTGISAASYDGARREAVSASDEAGLVEALTRRKGQARKGEKARHSDRVRRSLRAQPDGRYSRHRSVQNLLIRG